MGYNFEYVELLNKKNDEVLDELKIKSYSIKIPIRSYGFIFPLRHLQIPIAC